MRQPWILIPNHNGMRWLPECLSTLTATVPATTPILVVDNASTDASRDFIRQQFPTVRLLELEQNRGFVEPMNQVIAVAHDHSADGVLLLNNDTRFSGDWFVRLLGTAEHYPDVGILGPAQTDFEGRHSPRTIAILKARDEAAHQTETDLIPADWVEGSCMLIRDWVFDRIGCFDPIFAPAYFEEIDFCRRARAAGIAVALAPNASIQHFGAGTSVGANKRFAQRVLLERNYLLYHASEPSGRGLRRWTDLAGRALRHGAKQIAAGQLSPAQWTWAIAGVVRRLPALAAKTQRDRRQRLNAAVGRNQGEESSHG